MPITATNTINAALRETLDFATDKFKKRLTEQGHVLTGKLLNSIQPVIKDLGDIIQGMIELEDYGLIVDGGVAWNRVPYKRGSGRGGISKYIQGLIDFWKKLKGLSQEEATGAAFATANTHTVEGMPTENSSKYSSTGKRTGFIADTEKELENVIESILGRNIDNYFFNEMIKALDNG